MSPLTHLGALLSAAALTLTAAGCASTGLPGVVPPEVTLVNLSVAEVTPLETTLAVTVRCTNENPEPLVTTGAVYAVSLNGVRAGKALSGTGLELPRLGEATEVVHLRINNLVLLTELRGLLTAPSLEYLLESKLYVATERGERGLTSAQSGLIDLPASWGPSLDPLRSLPGSQRYAPESP